MKDLTIEQRIAAALTANDIISADLAALIAEVEGAGKAADENATRAREEALDPPSWSIPLRSACCGDRNTLSRQITSRTAKTAGAAQGGTRTRRPRRVEG